MRQQRRLSDLERQRAKAKEAYYADAISLDEFVVSSGASPASRQRPSGS